MDIAGVGEDQRTLPQIRQQHAWEQQSLEHSSKHVASAPENCEQRIWSNSSDLFWPHGNGGGFLDQNSATPFENPTGLTNWLSIFLLLSIPFALTYTFGKMVGSVRHGAALIIVNGDPTEMDPLADVVVNGSISACLPAMVEGLTPTG